MDIEKNIAANSEDESTPEIISIMNNISPEDPSTILFFGKEATDEISRSADKILKSFQQDISGESGQLLLKLNRVMKNFDKGDFGNFKEKGFFEKLFGKKEDDLLEKYNSAGSEIDKIFVQIKKYENEIAESNILLDAIYNNSLDYYHAIDNYILAGKIFVENFKQESFHFQVKQINEPAGQL